MHLLNGFLQAELNLLQTLLPNPPPLAVHTAVEKLVLRRRGVMPGIPV
jgi:hypothetical protein